MVVCWRVVGNSFITLVPIKFGDILGMTSAFLYARSSALIPCSAWVFIWGVLNGGTPNHHDCFNTKKDENSHPWLGWLRGTHLYRSAKPGIFLFRKFHKLNFSGKAINHQVRLSDRNGAWWLVLAPCFVASDAPPRCIKGLVWGWYYWHGPR